MDLMTSALNTAIIMMVVYYARILKAKGTDFVSLAGRDHLVKARPWLYLIVSLSMAGACYSVWRESSLLSFQLLGAVVLSSLYMFWFFGKIPALISALLPDRHVDSLVVYDEDGLMQHHGTSLTLPVQFSLSLAGGLVMLGACVAVFAQYATADWPTALYLVGSFFWLHVVGIDRVFYDLFRPEVKKQKVEIGRIYAYYSFVLDNTSFVEFVLCSAGTIYGGLSLFMNGSSWVLLLPIIQLGLFLAVSIFFNIFLEPRGIVNSRLILPADPANKYGYTGTHWMTAIYLVHTSQGVLCLGIILYYFLLAG